MHFQIGKRVKYILELENRNVMLFSDNGIWEIQSLEENNMTY